MPTFCFVIYYVFRLVSDFSFRLVGPFSGFTGSNNLHLSLG
ncbi:unnamed protein product [Arabidopsis halleri]